MNGDLLTDRAVGCLAGAAVGDALGGATEGWESHEIHAHFGGWVDGDRRVDPRAPAERGEAVLAVPQGRRPRHRRHADDARARRTPTTTKRDHLDAYDVEAPDRARDRRRDDVDPRARPRGPALPPALPRREVARAQAALRPRRPARRGRRQHRQLRRGDVHRAGRDRERRRPRRRVRRGARPHRGAPVELRPRGRGRARGRRRRGDAARRDRRTRSSRRALAARQGRARGRRSRRSSDAAAKLDGWRDGGLAELRRGVRAVRLGRRALRRARRRTRASRAGCTRSRSCRSRSACSSRPAATTRRRCSAASTTAATPTRSPRWAARSRARSGRRRCAATGSTRSPTASRIDVEEAGRAMAGGRRGDLRHGPPAPRGAGAGDGGAHRRRGPCLRVTWVQPEDLVGHELRQAREEGKDVDASRSAGSAPAARPRPARGASQEPVAAGAACARARAARRARRAAAPARGREPEGFEEILAAADPARRRGRQSTCAAGSRARGSAARPAACSASRSRTSRARASARSREATGNWPVARLVHGRGPAGGGLGALAVEPRQPARRAWPRTSTAIPEDDDLNFTMLGVALLERCGTGFDALDVAKLWLDYLPPGRIFTAERVAMRNLLEAYLPPETATRRNPFREWIGARLRVDAYGWAAPRRPGRARRGWRGRTRASATRRTASTRRCSWRPRTRPR